MADDDGKPAKHFLEQDVLKALSDMERKGLVYYDLDEKGEKVWKLTPKGYGLQPERKRPNPH